MTGFRHAFSVSMFLVLVAAAGCRVSRGALHPRHEPGQWYEVTEGESLAEIAGRAHVPMEDLLEVNGLRDAREVHAGSLIFVLDGPSGPMVTASDPRAPASPPDETGDTDGRVTSAARPRSAPGEGERKRARMRWPVDQPRVTSFFGTRWGRRHEGIDLTAPVGTPVYAAEVGEVVYAGNKLRGYGNMVVLRHAGDFMTVYAHNSVVLVKVGERVAVGQRVALSGQSGHATGPHVHFEVRKGQIPRDPLFFLPDLRGTSPKS